jgi:uncharacterized membrane protein YgcG
MNFSAKFSKIMIIAGLAIGVAGSVFAQSANTSVANTLKNNEAVSSGAMSVESMTKKKTTGGSGSSGGYSSTGGHSTSGGSTGGHGGPPQCVPEPASMLAMGIGAGVVALKRRRAAKKA